MILDDVTFDVVYPDLGVKHGVKVEKHLQGQHDQSSHGDWAHGGANSETDYQMSHRPPEPEDGAPAYDLTGNGNIYPKNVYDSDGARIYGHGGNNRAEDKKIHDLLVSIRNKPDAHVTIYRAVPKGVTKVNAGDWVTISEEYAKLHGESSVTARFGDYDILHTTVHANEIYTDGNSLYEWSYYPQSVQKHLAGQHDQSTHGNWAGHSGTKSDYQYPVADAIDNVVAGKQGKISPLDVHFFMEQMAKRQDNPDLTNLEIVGTHFYTGDNMGIPRDKMPQVPSGLKNEFLAEMDKEGISYKRVDLSPQALHPIQSEISASKSAQIMLSLEEKGIKDDDKSRIIVSSDNYVIDGHHRWAAILSMSLRDSSVKMPVIRVNVPAKELIDVVLAWNDVVGVAPIALGENNKNSAFSKALRFDIAILRAKIKSTEVEKHLQGQHDQSTHGRRFNSHVAPEVVHDVLSQVAENGGLSIKLTDGSLPPDGYMVSRNSDKFGTVVTASDFFNEKKGAKILGAFLIKNKSELGSGRAYLGVWHETTKTINGVTVEIPKEQQQVHLDVTDKVVSKKQAISLGRRRNQISIWDVVNFDEIQTGGTGGTVEKGSHKHSLIPETIESDDGRGNYGLGGKNLREVAEASVIVQVPVDSDFFKHFLGQHDQSSHGNWAHGTHLNAVKGGHSLTTREMLDLRKQKHDPLQNKIYGAEALFKESVMGKDHYEEMRKNQPQAPKSSDFESRDDYVRAFKDYRKAHTVWARESHKFIVSDLGAKNLNGTLSGIKKYITTVIDDPWFVETFGSGNQLRSTLEIKTNNSMTLSGSYAYGVIINRTTGREKTTSEFKIDSHYSFSESTLLHEIAHYATAISEENPHAAHGVEFAENLVTLADHYWGSELGASLRNFYVQEGVLNG